MALGGVSSAVGATEAIHYALMSMPDQKDSPACPRLENCVLHRRCSTTTLIGTFIVLYCKADFERCARFQVALSGSAVPDELLPNGKHQHTRA